MEAEMEVSGCSVLELEENKREPELELEPEPGTGNDADIGDAAEKGGPSEANGDGGADGSESRDTQQNLNLSSGPSGSGSEPKRTRLKLFNKVMEKSLQRLITDASFQRFAHTFHPFYKLQPRVTQSIHRTFISQLQTSIQDDISQIMEEGNLQAQLDELDRLQEEASDTAEPAWRPSGVPEQDFQSFLIPYYLQQQEFLRKAVKSLEQENGRLAQSVQAGRERLSEAEKQIRESLGEWQVSETF
ncbi:polyamine-modulated factor 1-like [Acipenser ruthenus]|uniref:polyamine-modulated factor 1-like n=1 Tax=Acipenser ruthenus TaxID=7906 RepID=UPI002741AC14|nr:polyamine-modulated factor 1-like [Acipenser ruthenus]